MRCQGATPTADNALLDACASLLKCAQSRRDSPLVSYSGASVSPLSRRATPKARGGASLLRAHELLPGLADTARLGRRSSATRSLAEQGRAELRLAAIGIGRGGLHGLSIAFGARPSRPDRHRRMAPHGRWLGAAHRLGIAARNLYAPNSSRNRDGIGDVWHADRHDRIGPAATGPISRSGGRLARIALAQRRTPASDDRATPRPALKRKPGRRGFLLKSVFAANFFVRRTPRGATNKNSHAA